MDQIFIQLVAGLQSAAWMSLGKVANPITGKIEKQLEVAKFHIDTLEMLRDKTKGNLSEEESKVLHDLLTELQVNYVDEATIKENDKEEPKAEEKKEEPKAEEENKTEKTEEKEEELAKTEEKKEEKKEEPKAEDKTEEKK